MSVARVRAVAPAKLNLWLRVFGRDAKGYHALESLFQLLGLADEITVERGAPGVRLVGAPPELGPTDQNLAVRAARWYIAAARTARTAASTASPSPARTCMRPRARTPAHAAAVTARGYS